MRDRLQGPATLGINGLQATARQQPFKALAHIEPPLKTGAALAFGELRIHRQQNARLAGKTIQDLIEVAGGNAVLACLTDSGVFGPGQVGHQRRGGQQGGEYTAAQDAIERKSLLCWHSGTPHENAS
ncbi:hypothetical protein D3C73_1030150 [compost metagenome]